jgi:hypothetical protein
MSVAPRARAPHRLATARTRDGCDSRACSVDTRPVAKKIVLPLLALVVLFLGVGFVVHLLTPDETKIRHLVADMEDAYNRGNPGDCVAPIARDWHHERYALDRQLLFGALLQTAQERDRETRELLTRVTIDEDAATVNVQGDHATLELEAVFERRRASEWHETWRIRVEAELEDRGDDWQIVTSRHQDLRGTHLGR